MRGETLSFVEGWMTGMLVWEGVVGRFEGVMGLNGDPCNYIDRLERLKKDLLKRNL